MGLILKDKLQAMIIGFPTISDKYNVAGGIYNDATASAFGDLVQYDSSVGYYKGGASASAITDYAGFIVGTNVKLAEGFPGTTVQVNQGEAFNLLINGNIAVELASASTTYITPGASVCVTLATGKLTTSDNYNASTAPYLPNAVLTGFYENQGTNASPKIVAELIVK